MQIRFQALSEWPIYPLSHWFIEINQVMIHKIALTLTTKAVKSEEIKQQVKCLFWMVFHDDFKFIS